MSLNIASTGIPPLCTIHPTLTQMHASRQTKTSRDPIATGANGAPHPRLVPKPDRPRNERTRTIQPPLWPQAVATAEAETQVS